jgi:pyridoxamine 5'-phosphate oxidase family protein
MARFTPDELTYLRASSGERQRVRLTIAGREGDFKIVPVRVAYSEDADAIEVAAPDALHVGINLPPDDEGAEIELVVEDLASIEPWVPRGVAITGVAEALSAPPRVRISPGGVRSWGL